MLEVAAQHAPPGLYPDVFRKRQTYWAVAAGPRPGDGESLLDEWGAFAPQVGAATLAPLIALDGELVSAQQAAEREYRLGGDGAPLPETTWKLASGLTLRIHALARRQAEQSLAEALLTRGPFIGAGDGLSFDCNGDSRRPSHITVVRDGQFVTLR